MQPPINFDQSLQRLQFIFCCSGLTYESKKLTPKNKIKVRCVFLFNFLWHNSDVIGAIYWFIDGVQTGKTFLELTFIAPCVTFSFLANLKSIFLIHYEDAVNDLIEKLRHLEREDEKDDTTRTLEMNDKINFRNQTIKQSKDNIRRKYLKFLHSVLKYSELLSVVLMILFNWSPFILMALKYYQTKEVELMLPLLIMYPFDSHDIRYWPLVYLHQFWSVCIVLLNICGADNLLYICCTYLGVQFRSLQHDIENIVEKNNVLMDQELDGFQEKCIQLVKWHQELIRLANMLEGIYAESTLFNFVSSSVLICLTGFNVIAIQNVVFTVNFLVLLSASLMQIYMLCFFGDFLMKSSGEVSDAVYNIKWYYLNAKSRKNLLIVQTRAQKSCKLTAFGFYDVNLKAFMSILSSAWSYFALLKTAYNTTPKN